MLTNHWKIEEGLEKQAGIKNIPDFKNRKEIVVIGINNKDLQPEWADNKTRVLVNGYADDGNLSDCVIETEKGSFNFLSIEKYNININNFERIIKNLIYERYYQQNPPFHSRLPINYTKIPISLRNFLFDIVLKLKTDPKWPEWPVEKSVELIRYLYIKSVSLLLRKRIPHVSFWPYKKKFAIAVTHDCDTESSFNNIDKIRDIEKKYSINSCWNVLSNKYRINREKLRKLKDECCEIGLHGYNHDNKTPFLKKGEIIERIMSASKIMQEFDIKGFRSESLLRNKEFLELLSNYFQYDSSTCDTDIYSPVAIRSGTSTVFPFFIKNMVEIPVTLPQDYRLMRLNKTKNEIFNIWKDKVDFIRQINGAVVLLTHPDSHIFGNDKYLDVYERILKYLTRFDDGWITTPCEIANWWVERDKIVLKNGQFTNSKRATISYIESKNRTL
ncbi:MAG: hypothetical protein AABX33_04450 [Nanoarchaeota archaeon]